MTYSMGCAPSLPRQRFWSSLKTNLMTVQPYQHFYSFSWPLASVLRVPGRDLHGVVSELLLIAASAETPLISEVQLAGRRESFLGKYLHALNFVLCPSSAISSLV